MYAVVDRIMTLYSMHSETNPATNPAPEPYKCIYTDRIKCFEKLTQLQKDLKAAEEATTKVKLFDGMGHHNARNNMLTVTAEYKKEYELCEKIMKMH